MSEHKKRLTLSRRFAAAGPLGDALDFVAFALARFLHDRGTQAAAALAYTTLLALVPLLAIGFAIFSAFPGFEDARAAIETLIYRQFVPEIAETVQAHLDGFMRNASKLGAFGLAGLALSAILLLATIEGTFNRIWRVERSRPLLMRAVVYWTVLTLGPLLIGLVVSSTGAVFGVIRHEWTEAGLSFGIMEAVRGPRDLLIAAILQSAGFAALFAVVPNRPVAWRDAAVGGATAGCLLELLKLGFGWYVTAFPSYQTIYGALAAAPIFLIWIYLSWTAVIVGAVFAAALPDWRALRRQSEPPVPPGAAQV